MKELKKQIELLEQLVATQRQLIEALQTKPSYTTVYQYTYPAYPYYGYPLYYGHSYTGGGGGTANYCGNSMGQSGLSLVGG